MRVLRFPAYDPSTREAAVQARAWVIMWSAVGAYPAGNKEQSHVGHSVWQALREASEESGDGGSRRLRAEGADIYLEDSEFRLVNNAMDKVREHITIVNVDALLYIDNMLDKAPEISKSAYKAGERLQLEN